MPEKSLAAQLLDKFESDRERITHYSAIAERCPLPAFITARNGTTMLYINPAYHHMTGRSLFDLQNGTWIETVVHPDDRAKVKKAWGAFTSDELLHPHWHRYVHVNGTVFTGMTLIDRMKDNGYVGFIVPQCGKQDCPVRNLNEDLWKLWKFTRRELGE